MTGGEVQIRKVTQTDIAMLQQISIDTFREAFSAMNTEEHMNAYVSKNLNKEKLRVELNEEYSAFYFVQVGNEVVGYLKINTASAQTEHWHPNSLEIERIYVLNAWHGKGVGQMLYDLAADIAAKQANDYIWLGVWEDNQRAIAFYIKNGFEAFDKHIFMLGTDAQTDIMMRLCISGKR
jgi:ribosomal protein S18 acetylase RimI-like enzyme